MLVIHAPSRQLCTYYIENGSMTKSIEDAKHYHHEDIQYVLLNNMKAFVYEESGPLFQPYNNRRYRIQTSFCSGSFDWPLDRVE